MSRRQKVLRAPNRFWSFRLRTRQTWERYWISYSLRRAARKLVKTQQWTVLLQLELDRTLLQAKELERLGQSLAHRQRELMDSQRYRVQGLLPPGPQHP